MDYSVMAPEGTSDVNIREITVLKKNGEVVNTLTKEPESRPPGGHISVVGFKIPAGMPPGTYVFEHKMQTGSSFDVRSAAFVVRS